ncbi:MAG: 30S ribosomal protein S8, partial [Patescibacteria group bacterium]
ADMLSRIRNAQLSKKPDVVIPYSKLKHNLANIFVKEGYIEMAEKIDDAGKPVIKVTLKYVNNIGVIREIKRISKPGRRVYLNHKKLPYVLDNLGVAVISTSKGLMTNKEARQKKLGGETLCEIY